MSYKGIIFPFTEIRQFFPVGREKIAVLSYFRMNSFKTGKIILDKSISYKKYIKWHGNCFIKGWWENEMWKKGYIINIIINDFKFN